MDDADDFDFPPCDACPDERPDPDLLAPHLDAETRLELPTSLSDALTRCARCLSRSGSRIDRAHVEAVMRALGGNGWVLGGRFAEAARQARPDLESEKAIVAEEGAALWDPSITLHQRIASLERLQAPEVVVAPLREALEARADAPPFQPEWHRVHRWPPPLGTCDRTLAQAEMAKTLAAVALPILGAADALPHIEHAADHARLDEAGWAHRERLAGLSDAGSKLAMRYLDELGQTDLRDNQDTLLDDTYFTLVTAGFADGADVYRVWLEPAFRAAWRKLRGKR